MNNSVTFKPTNFHHALIFTQGIEEYTLLDALKKKPISIQINSILSIHRLSTSKSCYVVRFQGKLINEFWCRTLPKELEDNIKIETISRFNFYWRKLPHTLSSYSKSAVTFYTSIGAFFIVIGLSFFSLLNKFLNMFVVLIWFFIFPILFYWIRRNSFLESYQKNGMKLETVVLSTISFFLFLKFIINFS